ncbi:MAG TPA: hypothetical protein VND23_04555 [Acidimicrobiales bacterium]|nr:hypothetical protein [Acidimicrobiales bacterium]
MTSPGDAPRTTARVLHVVVGHGLPTYFLNAVRSVRDVAGDDDLLIIDNASPQPFLRAELERFSAEREDTWLRLLDVNDLERNGKVGSLYDAYAVAFAEANARNYDLVHLVQADFQVLWWDADVVAKAMELYRRHPRCVNIYTALLSSDKQLGDGLGTSGEDGTRTLLHYGLTDTGLFHLARWRELGLAFGDDESLHAASARDAGLEVVCHPWPTDAPIPWPTVVRHGTTRGHEVRSTMPYLLKPLDPTEVAAVKSPGSDIWLEDVCVPWGWACLTPMWTTSLDTIDYWVCRYRDARRNGLRRLVPRLETRGVDWRDALRHRQLVGIRPSPVQLLLAVPTRELARRARARRERRSHGRIAPGGDRRA